MKGLVPLIKILLVFAVLALAAIGTLYTLDIIEDEVAREILSKTMTILGIWTAASVVTLVLFSLGNPPPPPPSKPAP